LDDSFDDHFYDRSRSLRAADGGERFERRGLLGDPSFGAEADETLAERYEGFHGAARSPFAGFGRERTGVCQPSVGEGGNQRGVRQALRGEALNPCPVGTPVDRRSVAEQVELSPIRHARKLSRSNARFNSIRGLFADIPRFRAARFSQLPHFDHRAWL
jgi:hypothetical protein